MNMAALEFGNGRYPRTKRMLQKSWRMMQEEAEAKHLWRFWRRDS